MPSNCVNCNEKLKSRWMYDSRRWTSVPPKKPPRCQRSEWGIIQDANGSIRHGYIRCDSRSFRKDPLPNHNPWTCNKCDLVQESVKMGWVYVNKRLVKPGEAAFFCGSSCQEHFGIRAAAAGFRLPTVVP